MTGTDHAARKGMDDSGMSFEEAWDLVPWLVNGTLDPRGARAVRAHLASSAALREEIAAQEDLCALVAAPLAADRESGAATEARFAALSHAAALMPSAPRQRSRRASLLDGLKAAPFALGGGLVAATIVAMVLLVPMTQPDGAFETLTDTPGAEVPTGIELRLRPAPGTDDRAVRASLDAVGASDIRISESGLIRAVVPREGLVAALDVLRDDPLFLVVAADAP